MTNNIIICSERYYKKKHILLDNLKIDNDLNVLTINTKSNEFSRIILKKIFNNENANIIIINDYLLYDDDVIHHFLNKNNDNDVKIFSKRLIGFDFSTVSNDLIISFNTKNVEKNLNPNTYSTLLKFQKEMVDYLINKKKLILKLFDKNKKTFIETDVNEEVLIKNVRKRKNRSIKTNKKDSKQTKKIKENDLNILSKIRDSVKDKDKPKILFLSDVKGWAWWNKTKILQKYLYNYYDIDVIPVLESKKPIDKKKYDLYFTYGYSYINHFNRIPKEKCICGVTAHRPLHRLKSRFYPAGWLHANSVLLYNELKQIHSNVFYTPNGVESDIFKKLNLYQNGELTIGHVGKKSDRKGQKEYIEPAVLKANIKYFSHYNNYKTRIPFHEMPQIYNNFDVYICASEEDGTPCPGLESASCGRPILSNKIGNMPELIENYKNGILLEKRDIDLYVDAIKWFEANPNKVIEMGNNIRKKIETEWTWELMSKNYLYMFDTILGIKRESFIYENPSQKHISDV